jgi:hypothetical protein
VGPDDSDFGQAVNWKLGTGQIPLRFSNEPKGSFRCMNHRQSTHHLALINQRRTGEHVEIK